MKFDLNANDKIRTGYFIDFQRRKNLIKDKKYIIEKYISGICSKQTYNKLVNGVPLKESEVYDQLLMKLGYKFDYNEEHTKSLNLIIEKMNDALDDKNLTKFYHELRKAIEFLLHLQEYPFSSITLQCFIIIMKSEKNIKISKKDFKFLIDSYNILDTLEKEVCAYYIIKHIYSHDVNNHSLNYMMKKIQIMELNQIYNKTLILNLMIRLQHYYDASIYCNQLIKDLKEKDRYVSYIECLIAKLFLISEIQPDVFEKNKEEFLKEIDKKKGKPYLCNFYHIAGLHYYREKNMEKAYDCFLKAINNKEFFFPEIIFLNHIATMLEYHLPDDLIVERNVDMYEEEWQIIYRFYCMKHQGKDLKTLEDYLWLHGRNLVKESYPSWIMKNIITTELSVIAEVTNDRRRLYQFNKLNV